jgi:plastocyanin
MKQSVVASLALAALAALTFGDTSMMAAGTVISGSVKSGSAVAPDAVVYIERAPGTFKPSGPAQMDQRSMKFIPHVLPVLLGTTVKFLNSDPTQHNVFSPDHEKYNLGTWPQGQTKEYVFDKCAKAPCNYVQLCRIHPEMEAYIVVLQNPYFAVADAQGQYHIDNVPAGSYSLGVWAPKGKAPAKAIIADGTKPLTEDFALGK